MVICCEITIINKGSVIVMLTGLKTLTDIVNKQDKNSFCKRDIGVNEITINFQMNKPATEENIDGIEKRLQLDFMDELATKEDILRVPYSYEFKLPYSYKEFLLKYNGGRIYDYENLNGFKLLGTENIININNELLYRDLKDIFVFCELIGESKYLGFDLSFNIYGEYRVVLVSINERLPVSCLLIAENFNKWLELLALHGGSKFWL